jgi:competence ComEA-like helix-hairpin-helix protein
MSSNEDSASNSTHEFPPKAIEVGVEAPWYHSLLIFLTDEHRQFLRWIMIGLLILLAAEWTWLVLEKPDPVLLERSDLFRNSYRVEINTASWAEWIQLNDIGPSTASRIVADRRVNGPFRSVDDLMRVPGIGKATLEKMRPFLLLQESEPGSRSPSR